MFAWPTRAYTDQIRLAFSPYFTDGLNYLQFSLRVPSHTAWPEIKSCTFLEQILRVWQDLVNYSPRLLSFERVVRKFLQIHIVIIKAYIFTWQWHLISLKVEMSLRERERGINWKRTQGRPAPTPISSNGGTTFFCVCILLSLHSDLLPTYPLLLLLSFLRLFLLAWIPTEIWLASGVNKPFRGGTCHGGRFTLAIGYNILP